MVTAYNCSKWLGKNLGMIERQTYRNFDVCVVDDASTDGEQAGIIQEFAKRNGWKTLFNAENQGALFNIVAGIKALECADDDIIVQMDGDDWLFDRRVLRLLDLYYRREDIQLTYGQYYSLSHRKRGICAPLAADDVEARHYRQMPWHFSHLRTFKFFLWRQIKDEDLRDRDGSYYRVSWDMAFMYPMLEMAGHHMKFIPDILYTYNDLNPICDSKVRREDQMRCERDIRGRAPYPCVLKGGPRVASSPLQSRLEIAWIRTMLRLKSWRVRDRHGWGFFR